MPLYNDGKKDKVGWNTGKAVSIDFAFLVTNWIAPRLAILSTEEPAMRGPGVRVASVTELADTLKAQACVQ